MKKFLPLILVLLGINNIVLGAQTINIEDGLWTIDCDDSNKLQIKYRGEAFLSDTYAEAKYNINGSGVIETITSLTCDPAVLTEEPVSDNFGVGTKYTLQYESVSGEVSLVQNFYFYHNYPYFLTDLSVNGGGNVLESNYLAPLVSETTTSFLSKSTANRMLWVPWDNDAWVRYNSYELKREMTSHEVTAVYNGDSRQGVIIGSIEHDLWKSGINIGASDNYNINKFSCFSGYVSEYSRDILPHGKVKGNNVRSAMFMIGYYDDWRTGMDQYGKANTNIVDRAYWNGGTPFGWSSWGSMQDKVSYKGATDVGEFLKANLLDKGFCDTEGKTVLSLDAWWNDNISLYNMIRFAEKSEERGQIPGIYYGPFCDWSGDPERVVEGSNGQYRYKDIWLKVNGGKHSQGGVCIDPTHPGTRMAMKYNLERYKSWGYKYIKVDFLTNGAIEGDSYYDPEVTTGTQAYNQGMQYMYDLVGDDMYIVLAISPLFPYQYAHGRRTCCDSYSRIGETEYVMNSTSYGWWTNQLYQVNDPDHLVMVGSTGTESYGENRARATSGAVTGAFIFGDNFSDNVATGFPEESRERAMVFMANADVNNMVRECKSFMPVEGHKATASNGAENLLMYETDNYVYMAVINYYTSNRYIAGTMTFDRLGLDASTVESIKELWSGADINVKDGGFIYTVPPSDAKIYRIRKTGLGIEQGETEKNTFAKISLNANLLIINSYKQMSSLSLFTTNGVCAKRQSLSFKYDAEINVSALMTGETYVLNIAFADGTYQSYKFISK